MGLLGGRSKCVCFVHAVARHSMQSHHVYRRCHYVAAAMHAIVLRLCRWVLVDFAEYTHYLNAVGSPWVWTQSTTLYTVMIRQLTSLPCQNDHCGEVEWTPPVISVVATASVEFLEGTKLILWLYVDQNKTNKHSNKPAFVVNWI